MRRTGNFRAKPEYRDILGNTPFSIREYNNINVAVEHQTGGTVLKNSDIDLKSKTFTKYFEPEYEWGNGLKQFASDIKSSHAWYIKYIDVDMGLVHQTNLHVALESTNKNFFPTKESAENFIIDNLKKTGKYDR